MGCGNADKIANLKKAGNRREAPPHKTLVHRFYFKNRKLKRWRVKEEKEEEVKVNFHQ